MAAGDLGKTLQLSVIGLVAIYCILGVALANVVMR